MFFAILFVARAEIENVQSHHELCVVRQRLRSLLPHLPSVLQTDQLKDLVMRQT